jgi:hypothetical protein
MKNRIEILQKVANKEITPKEADKELFVLYGVMRSSEPKGLIKHVNGTLRTVIKTNKEDAKDWYKQYLEFHKEKDQGISYLIGYFNPKKAQELKNWFGL